MPDLQQSINTLRILTECHCEPAWTDRWLHNVDCHAEDREDLDVLLARLAEVEGERAKLGQDYESLMAERDAARALISAYDRYRAKVEGERDKALRDAEMAKLALTLGGGGIDPNGYYGWTPGSRARLLLDLRDKAKAWIAGMRELNLGSTAVDILGEDFVAAVDALQDTPSAPSQPEVVPDSTDGAGEQGEAQVADDGIGCYCEGASPCAGECCSPRICSCHPGFEAAVELAMRFHETYERLAPSFDYETRQASAKPWMDVPAKNRRLMVAVAAAILADQERLTEKVREQIPTGSSTHSEGGSDHAVPDRQAAVPGRDRGDDGDGLGREAEADRPRTVPDLPVPEVQGLAPDVDSSTLTADPPWLLEEAIEAAAEVICEDWSNIGCWNEASPARRGIYRRSASLVLRAALPHITGGVLTEAADEIRRELICCDAFDRDKGTKRAGKTHAICFWAGASEAIVRDRAARAGGGE